MNKNIKKIIFEIEQIIEIERKKGNIAPVFLLEKQRKDNPFKALISTILSARTKDSQTYKAVEKIFNKINNPKELSELKQQEIEELIYGVGFYKVKAKNIKNTSEILYNKYQGIIPKTLKELINLPGVGIKTASLVLNEIYDISIITVDTHVHRISNRLGIIKTSKVSDSEIELHKKIPKEFWKIYNQRLVAFGQIFCKPIKPRCDECTLQEECNYYKQNGQTKILKK